MIAKLNKHMLINERVDPYFKAHIDWKSLSLKILKKINFNDGKFFTFLPNTARLDRLYDFKSGIHPPNPMIGNYEPVTRLSTELSYFIHEFLSKSTNELNRLSIIEHAYGEKSNPHIFIEDVKIKFIGKKEVYYILDSANSLDQIRQVISASDCAGWHFLAILTENFKIPDDVSDINICNYIRYIITTAYDSEGYIFWEKNPEPLEGWEY